MSDSEGIKSRLHTILSQKFKKAPEYEYTQKSSGRGGPRFECELTVEGFAYTAVGNSTSKKDAQTNAAREYFLWLLKTNQISQDDVPQSVLSANSSGEPSKPLPKPEPFKGGEVPVDNYFSRNQGPQMSSMEQNEFFDEQKMIEAEECDFTSEIHGNWTLNNCKARLNEYMQSTKQNLNQIVYSHSGPDHNRSYVAELKIYAKKVRKQLFAREEGSNKQIASRALCLSLVRQLYHAGEIEAYSGVRKTNKSKEIPFTEVKLRQDLSERLTQLIQIFKIDIPEEVKEIPTDGIDIVIKKSQDEFIPPAVKSAPRPIKWAPPLPNWNPWTAVNIDDGAYATMGLDQISYELCTSEREKVNNPCYQQAMDSRQKLPVSNYQGQILDIIGSNQVTLIRGETGCGKTTQIPQFILDSYINAMKGAECSVLVTQPRRISALSLAERIASERCEQLGESVGYCVRFETLFPRPYGSILFCTVGTLVRKMESGLRGISHIIIDEIHERDVNTDFLLILIKDMVLANPELRVILMSATIDVTMFQDYFPGCHMLDLVGRSYPVQTYFLEDCIKLTKFTNIQAAKETKSSKRRKKNDETVADDMENSKQDQAICMKYAHEYPDFVKTVMSQIIENYVQFELIVSIIRYIISLNVDGAILIFLPGWNMISMLKNHLSSLPEFSSSKYLVLPLHSQVPREEQKLVFKHSPPGVRKIVISTNIAESSITIDDVVFVIDSCLSRQKNFNFRNNMTSFSTTWASKTNLEQRRGRAGRVREGYAFHLCSRGRYDVLDQHATPEMLRTPLHELALLIKFLRLGNINEFLLKALEPPPLDSVIEAEFVLKDIKAIDESYQLTQLGAILAKMPVEPRIGKMIIFSTLFDMGANACLLGSLSSLGVEVFTRHMDRGGLSFGQKKFDCHKNSDHLTALNVFQTFVKERVLKGPNAAENLARSLDLNASGLKTMEEAANQIRKILMYCGFPESTISDTSLDIQVPNSSQCNILKLLLTMGLYPNIAYHVDKRKLLTLENKTALIHKTSVNCPGLNTSPFIFPFFVYGEKVRTEAVSCKGLTLVYPIMLILAGFRKAIWKFDQDSSCNLLYLDDWIPVKIDYRDASNLLALRYIIETILLRICQSPEEIVNLTNEEREAIQMLKDLSCVNACDSQSSKNTMMKNTIQQKYPPRQDGMRDRLHLPVFDKPGNCTMCQFESSIMCCECKCYFCLNYQQNCFTDYHKMLQIYSEMSQNKNFFVETSGSKNAPMDQD